MHVGFTGTQEGMTTEQAATVANLLRGFLERRGDELHHGDCVGADYQAALLADAMGYVIVAHPAGDVDDSKRVGYRPAGQMHALASWLPQQRALARNRDIVDSCGVLIAAPKEEKERRRSGTWATVRYAGKVGRRVELVAPDGTIREEWH